MKTTKVLIVGVAVAAATAFSPMAIPMAHADYCTDHGYHPGDAGYSICEKFYGGTPCTQPNTFGPNADLVHNPPGCDPTIPGYQGSDVEPPKSIFTP